MTTARDQDDNVHHLWTTGEIADRISDGTPEGKAIALRPIAAGLADQASDVTDPASILIDLARVLESIRSAVATIVDAHELAEQFDNDGDGDAPTATANIGLIAAIGSLDQLGNNI